MRSHHPLHDFTLKQNCIQRRGSFSKLIYSGTRCILYRVPPVVYSESGKHHMKIPDLLRIFKIFMIVRRSLINLILPAIGTDLQKRHFMPEYL